MNFYYGIRPTGDNLHIGHVMSLLNMFDKVKNNLVDISNIYILLAETHAEISYIPHEIIRHNSLKLSNKIISLFKSFLLINDINSLNIIDKVKFIYQNDDCGLLHRDLTYKYLPLVNTNDVLTNPIYSTSKLATVGFMLYPVLQAFDVLLYTSQSKETVVFVSGDQRANVNLMKDIYSKLKISDIIKFDIYDNVIYDYKCKDKMSKSLNNFVNFDNIDDVTEYVKKYKSFPRASKTSSGNYEECPFHNNLVSFFGKYMNCNFDYVKLCNSGSMGCSECKTKLNNYLDRFIKKYNEFQELGISINTVKFDDAGLKERYFKLVKIIDETRTKK